MPPGSINCPPKSPNAAILEVGGESQIPRLSTLAAALERPGENAGSLWQVEPLHDGDARRVVLSAHHGRVTTRNERGKDRRFPIV